MSDPSLTRRIVPLGDRLLVEVEDISDKRSGTIIMPDNRAERTRVATIIARGPDVKNPALAVGAKILMTSYAGVNFYAPTLGELDERLKFVMEDEILSMFN